MADRSTIRERLAWPASPELHQQIRRLWQRHSIAEDRRDIDGLIETLTPDCVYELVAMGQRFRAATIYATRLPHNPAQTRRYPPPGNGRVSSKGVT